MRGRPSPAWLAAKRVGYGSGLPIAWQGWGVLAAYLAIIVAVSRRTAPAVAIPVVIVATLALILVCARTTEGGWRWRGGD
jgi:hypothetical protein